MTIASGLLQELEQEAQTTRRLLERVPDNRLSWRPHEKGRTLGELAMHVAMVPGSVAELASLPSPVQAPDFADPPAPPNHAGAREGRSTRASPRRSASSAAWTTRRPPRRGV